MLITKVSPLTGKSHSMDLPVTQAQLDEIANGAFIQNVLSHLSADEREFIMTGYTAEDWKQMFPPEDEEPVEGDYVPEPDYPQ